MKQHDRRVVLGVAMLVLAVVLSGCSATSGTELDEGEGMPTAVPSNEALEAVAASKVFFAHQSVGMNILDGMPAVYQAAGSTAPSIVKSATPPTADRVVAHDYIGENRNPSSKIDAFAERIRSGYGEWADIAFMKFCYLDVESDSSVQAAFGEYKRTLTALEAEYPGVTFLHLTVPLTTQPGLKDRVKVMLGRGIDHVANNVARQKYNELVRAEYAGTGRLVDVALMESTTPTGERMAGESNGEPYYALYDGYASDYGHLNEAGAQSVAGGVLDVLGSNLGA